MSDLKHLLDDDNDFDEINTETETPDSIGEKDDLSILQQVSEQIEKSTASASQELDEQDGGFDTGVVPKELVANLEDDYIKLVSFFT